jgi:predicted ATPase
MREVHHRIHQFRIDAGRHAGDPIAPVSAALAKESWLFCFDELQVTDISDAMILRRLFDELFQKGVVVVTTSNRHPDGMKYSF